MPQKRNDIPAEAYIAYVRSLAHDAATVLLGGALHASLSATVYINTEMPAYLWLTLGLIVASVSRYYILRNKALAGSDLTVSEAAKVEFRYSIIASIHAAFLGAFGFFGIYLFPDDFAEIASIAIAMGTMISVVGRNYGSPRTVVGATLLSIFPIALGLVLRADASHFVLGLMILPFISVILKSSKHIRSVLATAIDEGNKARNLASRFDRALNTMPNGLVMFDDAGRAVVANHEAAVLLSFPTPQHLMGRTLKALLLRCVAAKLLTREECLRTLDQLGRSLKEGGDSKVLVNFANGRFFEFSARGGEGSLGVITFEEVTQRIEAERQIRNMARFDSLTGLPNRMHFREIVDNVLSLGDVSRMCALVIFDIDDFKQVNDTHGHPVGDGLIFEMATRLRAAAGDKAIVSRFGGDEFMLFFDGIADERELASRLDALFVSIGAPADVSGHQLRVSASAGASVALAFAVDLDSMIVKADLALYKTKADGKDGWLLFAPEMDRAFREKQALKAELRRAIERGDLRAVYQPIIDMKTMKVNSCEALARWTHPELGEVSPGVFIPLAEDMGIISLVSASMLRVACQECAKWPDGIGVSVNLSAVDFQSRAIVDVIDKALRLSGLSSDRLEIEVTETAILTDKVLTRSILEEIKAKGVGIALDDYGTGYSNLSYVHSLPLDKLKIDQSFLTGVETNPRSFDLLKATVRLAREMGLDVTVEGVETMQHLKVLSDSVRPDFLQGFVFGPPLPASGIVELAARNSVGIGAPKQSRRAQG